MTALGDQVTYESRTVRKILKISDRRLLVGDRLFLLQAPFNQRVLAECAKEIGVEKLLPVDPPSDGLERRAWLYVSASVLELLASGALTPLLGRFPQLPGRMLDLLEAHRTSSPEGAALWPLWKAELLLALPVDLRDRALDVWLDVASREAASTGVRTAFSQLALSPTQTKRLLTVLLPRKSALSAKEMILRKR